jgi:CheY-like chemotaxis protein
MKILLIEDSKFQRIASERALVKAGYDVIQAGDGEAGLRIARENIPDLVLLDMMLPKVSGNDVLRALKGVVLQFNKSNAFPPKRGLKSKIVAATVTTEDGGVILQGILGTPRKSIDQNANGNGFLIFLYIKNRRWPHGSSQSSA